MVHATFSETGGIDVPSDRGVSVMGRRRGVALQTWWAEPRKRVGRRSLGRLLRQIVLAVDRTGVGRHLSRAGVGWHVGASSHLGDDGVLTGDVILALREAAVVRVVDSS